MNWLQWLGVILILIGLSLVLRVTYQFGYERGLIESIEQTED